jgi:hypothetical protein
MALGGLILPPNLYQEAVMDKLYTFEKLARLWQVQPEVVHAHFKAGRLKGINVGIDQPEWRFHADDIARCVETLRGSNGVELSATPTAQARLSLPGVYRLNIKPGAAEPDSDPRAFCFGERIAGMGWAVKTTPSDWDTYRQLAATTKWPNGDGAWTPVITFHDAPDRSVIWTRDGYRQKTKFLLGLVIGPWAYRDDEKARAADIVNIRPVIWADIGGYDAVPASIRNAFTPITFAAIRQPEAVEFTEALAAQLVSAGIWPA